MPAGLPSPISGRCQTRIGAIGFRLTGMWVQVQSRYKYQMGPPKGSLKRYNVLEELPLVWLGFRRFQRGKSVPSPRLLAYHRLKIRVDRRSGEGQALCTAFTCFSCCTHVLTLTSAQELRVGLVLRTSVCSAYLAVVAETTSQGSDCKLHPSTLASPRRSGNGFQVAQ